MIPESKVLDALQSRGYCDVVLRSRSQGALPDSNAAREFTGSATGKDKTEHFTIDVYCDGTVYVAKDVECFRLGTGRLG